MLSNTAIRLVGYSHSRVYIKKKSNTTCRAVRLEISSRRTFLMLRSPALQNSRDSAHMLKLPVCNFTARQETSKRRTERRWNYHSLPQSGIFKLHLGLINAYASKIAQTNSSINSMVAIDSDFALEQVPLLRLRTRLCWFQARPEKLMKNYPAALIGVCWLVYR